MPTDTRLHVAIADERGSADSLNPHGLMDLAAALALNDWERSRLGRVSAELANEFGHAMPADFSDTFTSLNMLTNFEGIQHAARLGYALAQTTTAADHGWDAWVAAANAWLEAAGCGANVHQDPSFYDKDELSGDLQRLANAGRWIQANLSNQD